MHFKLSPIWSFMKYIPTYNSIVEQRQNKCRKSKIIKMLEICQNAGYNRPVVSHLHSCLKVKCWKKVATLLLKNGAGSARSWVGEAILNWYFGCGDAEMIN